MGDADQSSDSDSNGTGERAAAGRDAVARDGADIDVDHIDSIPSLPLDEDDLAFMHTLPPAGGVSSS